MEISAKGKTATFQNSNKNNFGSKKLFGDGEARKMNGNIFGLHRMHPGGTIFNHDHKFVEYR